MKQETIEKLDELKELIMKLDNQRVDFYNEDEGEYMWNGEELDQYEYLQIFSAKNWYYEDVVHIKSIYIEDDNLYFDAHWKAYDYNGNNCDDEDINHLEPEFVLQRFCMESQESDFNGTLECLIELIKETV